MRGIVLFGHGSRNREWAKPFHAICNVMLTRAPQTPVALGFLEAMQPSLDEAIDDLVTRGASDILIVPIFLATGSHITKDLPRLAASAMDRHPGISIALAAPAGESGSVIDAMAAYALSPDISATA